MTDTQPVFIVGSGRSGTTSLSRMFAGCEGLGSNHEYCCTHIQPYAAMYAMDMMDDEEMVFLLETLHGAAIHYSRAPIWIDCSNKLSWVIKPLLTLFPSAKFVLVTRDGRKVASSFFHKLSDEMYDDKSVAILDAWLKDDSFPQPPPEKKYWWNIPQKGQPFHAEFPSFNQFERCCYHWRECNRVVLDAFETIVPKEQQMTIELERITSNKAALKSMCDFIGVPYDHSLYEFLQKPNSVIFPMDFKLTTEQSVSFERIAGDMQKRLGYVGDEYAVRY